MVEVRPGKKPTIVSTQHLEDRYDFWQTAADRTGNPDTRVRAIKAARRLVAAQAANLAAESALYANAPVFDKDEV